MLIKVDLEKAEEFIKENFFDCYWGKYANDISDIKQDIINKNGDILNYTLNWDSNEPDGYFVTYDENNRLNENINYLT